MNTASIKVRKNIITLEVRELVLSAIYEILYDLDVGMELSGKAKKRLRQVLSGREKTISLAEVHKRHY